MSGIDECPVSKYGKSSEFGVVLDFIQTMISNDTLRQAFNIPHLVMVGRQNMAKTTLINRLIGRYLLPMRRNETANTLQARTTYPIILNLRNGEKTTVEVKCDKYPHIGGEVENPTDDMVEDFLKQVASHLPKEQGTLISKTPVNVTLQGKMLSSDVITPFRCSERPKSKFKKNAKFHFVKYSELCLSRTLSGPAIADNHKEVSAL